MHTSHERLSFCTALWVNNTPSHIYSSCWCSTYSRSVFGIFNFFIFGQTMGYMLQKRTNTHPISMQGHQCSVRKAHDERYLGRWPTYIYIALVGPVCRRWLVCYEYRIKKSKSKSTRKARPIYGRVFVLLERGTTSQDNNVRSLN